MRQTVRERAPLLSCCVPGRTGVAKARLRELQFVTSPGAHAIEASRAI